MKIIVTGAAGFIGSHLAEQLADEGHAVVGVDCFTDYYALDQKERNASEVKERGVEIQNVDLASDDLTEIVADAEVIYHLAAQPGISNATPFEDYVNNNLVATQRLLNSVYQSPTLKMFINIATSSVYGAYATSPETEIPKPISYYGVTKLAAENLVMSYHLQEKMPACSLRLFSVYGERERPEKLYPKLIRAILEDRDFPLYDGSEDHTRSFTYVGDIIKGFMATLANLDKCNGEVINIGWDQENRVGDCIEIVEKLMGKKAKLVSAGKRKGDQISTKANIDKARELLGYNPKTPVEEGLAAEVEWFSKQYS